MPLPASLAHLKRRIPEKKWPEALAWSRWRISPAVYRLRGKQTADPVAAKIDSARLVLLAEGRG